jgi:uncharacterized membrane protein YhhN
VIVQNERIRALVLLAGLAAATLGMALVTIGVVVAPLFFPGVYLLGLGLLVSAVGAFLRL